MDEKLRYLTRRGVRIFLNLASVVLNSACIARHTDVRPAQAFPEVLGRQVGIVHGKSAGRHTFKITLVWTWGSFCDHRGRIQPARLYHPGALRSVGGQGVRPVPQADQEILQAHAQIIAIMPGTILRSVVIYTCDF